MIGTRHPWLVGQRTGTDVAIEASDITLERGDCVEPRRRSDCLDGLCAMYAARAELKPLASAATSLER
jgi:hypothetical protein